MGGVGKTSFLLFLLGLFSRTQIRVVGNIAIAELIVFLAAPLVFFSDYSDLRRHGFMPAVGMSFLVMIGCVASSVYNNTPLPLFFRGFATAYSIFSFLVIYHFLMKRNLGGIRWVFLGISISCIINIFIFQEGLDSVGTLHGQDNLSDAVVGSALFWVDRVSAWGKLPINGWYFSTPIAYSAIFPFVYSIFCIFVTASGRSAALGTIFASALILLCRKSRVRMQNIGRHFVKFGLLVIVVGLIAKWGYSKLAISGILGDKQQEKYFQQTRGGTDALAMLRAGRAEFFIGLTAAIDRPLIGFGPWAPDVDGYTSSYMHKHGTIEDIKLFEQSDQMRMALGIPYRFIPSHSQIIGFWINYGIVGLFFWIYILKLYLDFFRKYTGAIPQWFGFFALSIPDAIWHCFFSPFGGRGGRVLLITAILFARAVGRGLLALPQSMQEEIWEHDRG